MEISDDLGLIEPKARRTRKNPRSGDKTRKSIETRRRIMEVTAKLMVERGNTAFQMSEISARCGMSKGALYYYYADKEDLVIAVYDQELDVLVDELDAAVQDADSAVEALSNVCRRFEELISEGSPLAMAMVRELVLVRDVEDATKTSKVHYIVGMIANLIDYAKREGAIREDVDSHLAALAVCGAYTFVGVSVSDNRGEEGAMEGFAPGIKDIIVRGVGKKA